MTDNKVINTLNEKFKERNEKKYQIKIDKMLHQIDIALDYKFWKNYIESSVIVGETEYKGEDSGAIVEKITFENEILVYFIYKIALELSELKSLKLHLKVFQDSDFFRKKQYFDSVIALHDIENQGGIPDVVRKLDALVGKTSFKGFTMHGRVKKKTAYLLSYNKRNNFNWNTKDNIIKTDIKVISKNQQKEVICPVCNKVEYVDEDNKKQIFHETKGKVTFNCNHEKSENISKKKVSIPIKKNELPEGVNAADFVLFNWKYYAKQWKVNQTNEEE